MLRTTPLHQSYDTSPISMKTHGCFTLPLRLVGAIILVVTCMPGARGQFYEQVYSFTEARAEDIAAMQNTGWSPYAGLIQGDDGDFYGTTAQGGVGGNGTLFKITRAGVLTTLVAFTGTVSPNMGGNPQASLIQASDQNYYGTTNWGGSGGFGTVFMITSGGVLTTLVEFNVTSTGMYPFGALVQAGNGEIYGTTQNGGAGNGGTVFKMTPGGVLTTLVEFTNNGTSNRGSGPRSALIEGLSLIHI